MNVLAPLGRVTLIFLAATGRIVQFTAHSLSHCVRPPFHPRLIADRIAMIREGRIIWAGPTGEVDASGNPDVEQFIHGNEEGPIQLQVRTL